MKHIILNIGSAFLSLNDKATVLAFGALAKQQGIPVNWPVVIPAILSLDGEFKIGKLSANDFRSQVTALLNIKLSDAEFDAAWNAMLGDTSHLIEQITEVKNNLKEHDIDLILTTNSNPIHVEKLAVMDHNESKPETSRKTLAGLPFYVSYEHHGMHQDLYEIVMQEEKLEPSETHLVVPVNGVNLVLPAKERDDEVQAKIKEWALKVGVNVLEYEKGKESLTGSVILAGLTPKRLFAI